MKKQNKNRGYPEKQKPIVTHRGKIEDKAPEHYRVSHKKQECTKTISKPFAPPAPDKKESDETVILTFENNVEDDKEFNKLADDFFKENPKAEFTLFKNTVKVPEKYAEDFMDFLNENGVDFDVEGTKESDINNEDDDEVEKIIDKVQEDRKPQAVAQDAKKTAKKLGDKSNIDDLLEWIKEPGKSDLKDVDTKHK